MRSQHIRLPREPGRVAYLSVDHLHVSSVAHCLSPHLRTPAENDILEPRPILIEQHRVLDSLARP